MLDRAGAAKPLEIKGSGESVWSMEDADGGDGGFEWRCENCGARTPKHNPPCSRCGNMQFEQVPLDQQADYEAAESLVPTSRRAVLGYGLAGASAILGGGYLLYDEYTPPAIPDAPGQSERANGIELADVETTIVERVNAERETPLERADATQDAARYATAYVVNHDLEDDAGELYQGVSDFHIGDFRLFGRQITTEEVGAERAIEAFDDETGLAAAVLAAWLDGGRVQEVLTDERYSTVGVDVHVDENGDVYSMLVVATGDGGIV